MPNIENSDSQSRFSIIEVMDGFIDKINQIGKTLLGISISALILAPLAIGLSSYLILHPHFFFILDEYDEFGVFLAISLVIIIIISVSWLVLGIRQYLMLKSWNKKYSRYSQRKDQVDNQISSEFNLDEEQES
ncbi:MAG: hypothetical protein HYU00_04210 [Nitrosarchaeum sp.]|nr:hypothetical protein [Nitrosarchaeum sp.]